jgi:mRNA interferase MazF
VLCPITNTVRGWRFEVLLLGTGCKTTGTVLRDQVKSLSWTDRNAEYIEAAPPQVLAEARAKAKALLGL